MDHLIFLYGSEQADSVWSRLETILDDFYDSNPSLSESAAGFLSQRDAMLITYGDQISEPGRPPLQTLAEFVEAHLCGVVSGVHILPFYPYSSDDGFSVIDYRQVDPSLGTWDDVACLEQNFRLMFDAVINHISRHSRWFQGFVRGESPYTDYFIPVDPDIDLSAVVRPRALPLLTPVETVNRVKHVWTTFSDDQIDLNYANPEVLLEILDLLLFYAAQGAAFIRLDAIAYLWKEIGTSCIHLPQTHRVIKLFRAVLDAVAPDVILITETNVPHEENISYFGDPVPETGSTDEAQLVYQFPLPPLVMHSLVSGSARALSEWAAELKAPPQATFFNFTASHDGIGVMPVRGLLSEIEVQALIDTALAHGGKVSYKANADGSRTVYELNISYFDALSDPAAGEPQSVQVKRFIVSQAIMLAMAGLPGIYVHSLLGSRNWREGVAQTGHNRTINRQKFDRASLEAELAAPDSLRHQVFSAYTRLLRARAAEPAFHPYGRQQVLFLNKGVFALLRISLNGESRVLCLHNVSAKEQPVQIDLRPEEWRDLLTGEKYPARGNGFSITLPPYAVRWLKKR
ncbi:MAG: sugar phosphorylase [Anaerolineaceae bacterium 4572_32.1]|nr:MAG: sugar phosphorylase [Anaerolineaceae bacterium 4572_32.1]